METMYDSEARSKALTCQKGCTCKRHTKPRDRSLSSEEAISRLREKNLTPLEPWHGSTQRPWKVKCMTCGHEGAPRLASLKNQSGCRPCGYRRREEERKVEEGAKALSALIESGFTPLEEYDGLLTRIKCEHTCGAIVSIKPLSIKQAIKNKSIILQCDCQRGEGALSATKQTQAFAEMRDAGHEPLEAFKTTHTPWRTIHLECGEERRPRLGDIRKGGSGCYPCSRKSDRWKHKNTITEEEATAYVRERGFEPIGEYKNTQTPWKMRHSCGAIVTPSLTNLRGGTGCKACNSTFNYMEEAIVYLLKNTALNALKVGVAGKDSGNRRINDSLRYGFDIVQTWAVPTGQDAVDIESEVLRHWRDDLNAPVHVAKEDIPRGGHTETASMRKVGMHKTVEYINNLV